jgi:hypothetical protein
MKALFMDEAMTAMAWWLEDVCNESSVREDGWRCMGTGWKVRVDLVLEEGEESEGEREGDISIEL